MFEFLSESNLKEVFYDFDVKNKIDHWILEPKISVGSYNIKLDKGIKPLLNEKRFLFKYPSMYTKSCYNKANMFENVVRIVYQHPSLTVKPYKSKNLNISISSMSDNYSLFFHLSNPLDFTDSLNLDQRLKDEYSGQTVDFIDVLNILNERILKLKSLKIKSSIPLSYNSFYQIANSYLFNCAHTYNAVITMKSIFKDNYPLHPNNDFYYNVFSIDINDELLDYYQRGITLEDPFISFISFYHILEYPFKIIEKEFKKKIILKVSNEFMGSEDDFKDIILMNNLKNERKLLELVFRRFINKEQLINDLNYHEAEYYSYLKKEGVKFANADPLDDQNFYRSLVNRIYLTRNALVHRKENFNDSNPKYLPFKKEHKNELRKELLLIKTIVERIIPNSINSK